MARVAGTVHKQRLIGLRPEARASWGKTGNQQFANYRQYSSYTLGDALSRYSSAIAFFTTIRPSAVDPNIKWEQTRAFNIGLDLGFANQRISGCHRLVQQEYERPAFSRYLSRP